LIDRIPPRISAGGIFFSAIPGAYTSAVYVYTVQDNLLNGVTMLNRENALYIFRQGDQLVDGKKWQNSRSLRRFLASVVEAKQHVEPFVTISWSNDEGHNAEQLDALENYAEVCAQRHREYLSHNWAAHCFGVSRDDMYGKVYSSVQMNWKPETASLAQLQQMVRVVVMLADSMREFAENANETVLKDCPEYAYRGLPCSIALDEDLWCIAGHDKQGGSGVLEWCYGEEDAQMLLRKMNCFPRRFPRLVAEPYLPQSAG
jgi:hypothetical protein